MSDPRPGPGLLRALGALAAGSVLAFVAFGQPWVTVTVREPGLPAAVQAVTGRDLAPAPAALPVLLLALVLAIWATGGWLRRLVGGIVVVASVVVLVAAVRGAPGLLPPDLQVRYGLTGVATYDPTYWWVLATAGALAALVAGVLTTVHRGRWARMTGRYERGPGTGAPARPKAVSSQRAAWDQLDAGADPTDPTADPTDPTADPSGEADPTDRAEPTDPPDPAGAVAGTMSASPPLTSGPGPSTEPAATEENRR